MLGPNGLHLVTERPWPQSLGLMFPTTSSRAAAVLVFLGLAGLSMERADNPVQMGRTAEAPTDEYLCRGRGVAAGGGRYAVVFLNQTTLDSVYMCAGSPGVLDITAKSPDA